MRAPVTAVMFPLLSLLDCLQRDGSMNWSKLPVDFVDREYGTVSSKQKTRNESREAVFSELMNLLKSSDGPLSNTDLNRLKSEIKKDPELLGMTLHSIKTDPTDKASPSQVGDLVAGLGWADEIAEIFASMPGLQKNRDAVVDREAFTRQVPARAERLRELRAVQKLSTRSEVSKKHKRRTKKRRKAAGWAAAETNKVDLHSSRQTDLAVRRALADGSSFEMALTKLSQTFARLRNPSIRGADKAGDVETACIAIKKLDGVDGVVIQNRCTEDVRIAAKACRIIRSLPRHPHGPEVLSSWSCSCQGASPRTIAKPMQYNTRVYQVRAVDGATLWLY
ncbi:hypothetical protein PHYSODRAFT_300271 [Phytophthora sojae]|uniref:Uncharacterized protein n=1 Tax=Phytophthora sojae (strain P6497) TaxID=1094619 RepID=G4ZGL4_PHYSP|nr:hypothetical protein PHYSODRAFT_300271 [Phytophthora sojae]EGZ17096.1 hypothetical protein PHYSODRAFT_300271 [Phytophthora sojae]|eukprot:XP_009526154.1 hypothetical protein PHYSODRAFT_300271 [Phytophthora sojae]